MDAYGSNQISGCKTYNYENDKSTSVGKISIAKAHVNADALGGALGRLMVMDVWDALFYSDDHTKVSSSSGCE